MKIFNLALLLAAPVLLTGCNTSKRLADTPVLSFVSLAKPDQADDLITALNGGLVSRAENVQLDAGSRRKALEAEYRALEGAPTGQAIHWQGNAVSGDVVAAAPYQVGSQNCRQYTQKLTGQTAPTVVRGVACRNDDGSWTPLI